MVLHTRMNNSANSTINVIGTDVLKEIDDFFTSRLAYAKKQIKEFSQTLHSNEEVYRIDSLRFIKAFQNLKLTF